MTTAVFLPGAGGRTSFWQPAAAVLDQRIRAKVLGWPGFGDVPRSDLISNLRDLAGFVLEQVNEPVDLVAQSMGGVVAVEFALEHPDLVRRLVLVGTSGGVDVARFGGEDWRADSLAEIQAMEDSPRWFIDDRTDLTDQIRLIESPVLLIWGEDDRISPPAVGEFLNSLLVDSRFVLTPGGHDHPLQFPGRVSALISDFLLDVGNIAPSGAKGQCVLAVPQNMVSNVF